MPLQTEPRPRPQLFDQDDPSTWHFSHADVQPWVGVSGSEQQIANSSFTEQFNNRKSIESRGAQIDYVEVKPENLDPEAIPILLAGGWTEGPDAFRGTMEKLYEQGNWVISVDHPFKGDKVESIENVPRAVLRKTMNYHDVLDVVLKDTGKRANVIAHSAGGEDAAVLALLYPEKVQDIILSNSVGLLGKQGRLVPALLKLGGRFAPKMARTAASAFININAARGLFYGTKNITGLPGSGKASKAWTEVKAISQSDIEDLTKTLRMQGTRVGVLESWSDPGFPVDKTEKKLVSHSEAEDGTPVTDIHVDAWAHNIKRRAGHDELIIHPERAAVAADDMLRMFKAQREARPYVSRELQEFDDTPPAVTRSRRIAAAIHSRWSESKVRDFIVTGEHAKRNRRWIARGIGIVAAAGAGYLAYKRIFDGGGEMPNIVPEVDQGGSVPEPSPDHLDVATTIEPQAPGPEALPPAPRGDISANLELPDGYISEVTGGYEVVAMPGHETDSIWRGAEHALRDRLGGQPSVVQIDALQDILGDHFLNVGDRIRISNEQIERALEIARLNELPLTT